MTLPDIATRTQRKPVSVDGVTFLSYRTGISRYALFSEDGRGCVSSNHTGSTYSATLDRAALGRLFRSERAACAAIAKALRAEAAQ